MHKGVRKLFRKAIAFKTMKIWAAALAAICLLPLCPASDMSSAYASAHGVAADPAAARERLLGAEAAGYALYADGKLIGVYRLYREARAAVAELTDALAAYYGAPEGEHSLANEVEIVRGTYPLGMHSDDGETAELLASDGGASAGLRLTTKVLTEEVKSAAASYKIRDTNLLPEGNALVLDEGTDGELLERYELIYVNGSLSSKSLVYAELVSPPSEGEIWRGKNGASLLKEGELLSLPYAGVVTSEYGNRTLFGVGEMHSGMDFAAHGGCYGDPILSAADGIVSFAGYSGAYGYKVVIAHNRETETVYAHCSEILVREGQAVKRGETVALIGNTGKVTGAHLHFELLINGVRVNPRDYLNWSGAA